MRTNEAQGKITEAEALAKHELYVSTMEELNFRSTHSVNFTLDNLKKFIAEVEAQAQGLNITGELGMRIFFGATCEDSSAKLTAFLTPTHVDEDGIQNTGRLYLNYGTCGTGKPRPDENDCED